MRSLLILAIALAAVGSMSYAQVQPTQGGRELDSNYRIGSDGFNSRREVDPSGRLSGNLFITGQVTQGFSFRRPAPYFASDQLNLNLPSERSDNFVRDSTGLPGIVSGTRGFGPQPYFSPPQTVFGVQGTLSGLAMPGSNAPPPASSGMMSPEARRLYSETLQGYRLPSVPVDPRLGQALRQDVPFTPPDVPARPEASLIFGVLRPEDTQRLTDELETRQLARSLGDPQDQTLRESQPLDQSVLDRPAQPLPAVDELLRQEDVFTDLLVELYRRRQAEVSPYEDILEPEAVRDGVMETDPRQDPSRRQGGPVDTDQEVVVIRSLAGVNPNIFNRYMSQGEAQMRRGEFYDAAQNYQNARILQRSNPLPAIGAGLALFAAGETFTAAHYIVVAMELFPPMMEVRLDLRKIMGEEVVNERLEDIQRRLEAEEIDGSQWQHVFLLTFFFDNLNRQDEARHWAETLLPLVEPESMPAMYARHVLTGESPAIPPR